MAGRKKGSKGKATEMKAQLMAQKVIEEHKTIAEAAAEVGVHESTGSRLLKRAMGDEEIRSRIQRSKERLIKMLSRCDQTFLDVFNERSIENFGNRLKAATSIYRTMGVLSDEALIKVTNVTPIIVKVENRVYTIGSDPSQSSS